MFFGNFFGGKMLSFWQFFDIQMAIFRRVSWRPHLCVTPLICPNTICFPPSNISNHCTCLTSVMCRHGKRARHKLAFKDFLLSVYNFRNAQLEFYFKIENIKVGAILVKCDGFVKKIVLYEFLKSYIIFLISDIRNDM